MVAVQTPRTVLSENYETVYQSKGFLSFTNLALGGSPRLNFHQEFIGGIRFLVIRVKIYENGKKWGTKVNLTTKIYLTTQPTQPSPRPKIP